MSRDLFQGSNKDRVLVLSIGIYNALTNTAVKTDVKQWLEFSYTVLFYYEMASVSAQTGQLGLGSSERRGVYLGHYTNS